LVVLHSEISFFISVSALSARACHFRQRFYIDY
jgi:hypothetical protein